MAKVKLRPEMTARADYEADFFAWTQEQARLLRDRDARGPDWENLAEEIELMGRRDRRELESRLRLILHPPAERANAGAQQLRLAAEALEPA